MIWFDLSQNFRFDKQVRSGLDPIWQPW
jgi:hypothetical protein